MSRHGAIRLLVIAAAAVLAVVRFVVLDSASHSASDTLRPWAIEMLAVLVVVVLVMRGLSRLERREDRS